MVTRVVNRGVLLEIDAATVGTSYTFVGVLPGPARVIKFKNYLNGAVYLTYDLTENQMWFPASLYQIENHTANSPANGDVWDEPQGRAYYIKWDGSAPGSPTGKFVIETDVPKSGV